ncbi:MAG TPA: ribonuclease HII [Candidatus Paceibacterota bacterium]
MRVKKTQYIIGIDEAGRGPLAGPVSVAAVATMSRLSLDNRLRDSKKLSEKKREQWFKWLKQKQKSGQLKFTVSLVGEKIIDRIGIVLAIRIGIKRCLSRLTLNPKQYQILLDGSLYAPKIYRKQKTIIRGDEQVPIIMLASIAAKVRRDQRMCKLALIHPDYGFEIHKGYGTRSHYVALRRRGLSPLHRRSFLKNFQP